MATDSHLLLDSVLQTQAKRLEAQMLQQLQDKKTIEFLQTQLLTTGHMVTTLETRHVVQMRQIEANLSHALQLYEQARGMRQQQNSLASVISTLSTDFQRLHAATTPKGSRIDKEAAAMIARSNAAGGRAHHTELPSLAELLPKSAAGHNAGAMAAAAAAAARGGGGGANGANGASGASGGGSGHRDHHGHRKVSSSSSSQLAKSHSVAHHQTSSASHRGGATPAANGGGGGGGAGGGSHHHHHSSSHHQQTATGHGKATVPPPAAAGATDTALEALTLLSAVASANGGRASPVSIGRHGGAAASAGEGTAPSAAQSSPSGGGIAAAVAAAVASGGKNAHQQHTMLTAQSLTAHDAAGKAIVAPSGGAGSKRTHEESADGGRASTMQRRS